MINQRTIEKLLHPKHLLQQVRDEIEESLHDDIMIAIKLINDWLSTPMWESIEFRKGTLKDLDAYKIASDIISAITLHCRQPLPLVSIAGILKFSEVLDELEGIQLACDLIALLAPCELYTLNKSPSGTYVVESLIQPSESLTRAIKLGCYLPPMIERPKLLTCNRSSGYQTIDSSPLISKAHINHHDNPISLDVLNTLGRNEYELNTYISDMEKPWNLEVLTVKEIAELPLVKGNKLDEVTYQEYMNALISREMYLEQFNYLKQILTGKTLYFNHVPDKRGRIYVCGYHFSTQGSDYEKACIDLKHKEVITGEL